MFYILNFATHQFLTCHTIPQVVMAIANILKTGVDKGDIEIVNCFEDDSRLSVNEFFDQFAQEEGK